MRFRFAFGWLTGSALASRILGASVGIVTARTLGPDGRGTFAILVLFGLIGGAVASGGLDFWAARVVAAGVEPASARAVLARQQLLAACAAVGISVLALLAGASLALTGATALLCWATGSAVLRLGLIQGTGRMRAYGAATVVGTAAYAVMAMALAATGHPSVAAFLVAAAVGKMCMALWPVRNQPTGVHCPSHREAFRFGVPSMLGGIATLAMYRMDVALVAWWGSTSDAGLYSVALAIAEVLWILPNAASQAVLPRAAQAVSALDTAMVCRAVTALMLVAGAGVSVAGPVIVPLAFGSDFAAAWTALPPLAVGAVAVGVWKILSYDLLARGDAQTRFRSATVAIGAMVAADAILVPAFGIVGAAIGSAVACTIACAYTIVVWKAQTPVRLADLLILTPSDVRMLLQRRTPAAERDEPAGGPL